MRVNVIFSECRNYTSESGKSGGKSLMACGNNIGSV